MRTFLFIIHLATTMNLSAQVSSIPFIWLDSDLNGEHFEKTSMHIPVKFENDSSVYYFQLDTGSNKSYIYTKGNADSSLVESCTNGDSILSNIGLLHLIPRQSNKVFTENGKTFIGTIGADFLANKKIEIDFPNERIRFLNSYDTLNYEIFTSDLSFGRPTITLKIKNRSYRFLYDTGSSLFDLWTNKRKWRKWKMPNCEINEFPISSWGKINTASRTKLRSPIAIGNQSSLLITQIWYISNKKFSKGFRRANVTGIIGNKLFLDRILLIDVKNKRLGIKEVHNNG